MIATSYITIQKFRFISSNLGENAGSSSKIIDNNAPSQFEYDWENHRISQSIQQQNNFRNSNCWLVAHHKHIFSQE